MTNQPAEGTFSRLMATTAPMREKQREEQERAPRPPGATVTSPVVETPQPQKAKNQWTTAKKSSNQQTSKGSNALQQDTFAQNVAPSSLTDKVSPPTYPSATPKKREIKRRQPFDVYQDQVDLLKKLSLRDQMNGEIGSMSRMVREALDNYLKDKKI
jgi:hypothetical protein